MKCRTKLLVQQRQAQFTHCVLRQYRACSSCQCQAHFGHGGVDCWCMFLTL